LKKQRQNDSVQRQRSKSNKTAKNGVKTSKVKMMRVGSGTSSRRKKAPSHHTRTRLQQRLEHDNQTNTKSNNNNNDNNDNDDDDDNNDDDDDDEEGLGSIDVDDFASPRNDPADSSDSTTDFGSISLDDEDSKKLHVVNPLLSNNFFSREFVIFNF